MIVSKQNNFDVIRLGAATQVMVLHSIEHLHLPLPPWSVDLIARFPGVPVFFVISGFLVSKAFERNSRLHEYARNRALRIYPGLYACLVFSILSVVAVGYLPGVRASVFTWGAWLVTQLTFFQFYRAPFLDGYATGTLNGSLWTIPVELQFYAVLPLVYAVLPRTKYRQTVLMLAIAGFAALNVWRYGAAIDSANTVVVRALKMSFALYVYMFLLGVLVQQNFAKLEHLFRGKVHWWLVAHIAASYGSTSFGIRASANGLNPVCVLVLAGLILSAAFTATSLSDRVLRRQDISYGIYIYHMPIINVLVYSGPWRAGASAGITVLATSVCAALSWRFVERPCLALKHTSARNA